MERTDRQVRAAVRELQRKIDKWWSAPNSRALLTVTAAASEDLAEIIVTAAATETGEKLQERRFPRNTGAWELFACSKSAAAHAAGDAIERFLANERAPRLGPKSGGPSYPATQQENTAGPG